MRAAETLANWLLGVGLILVTALWVAGFCASGTEPPRGYHLIDLESGETVFTSECPLQWFARIPDALVGRPILSGTTYSDGWLVLAAQGNYMTTKDEGYEAPPICGVAYGGED